MDCYWSSLLLVVTLMGEQFGSVEVCRFRCFYFRRCLLLEVMYY